MVVVSRSASALWIFPLNEWEGTDSGLRWSETWILMTDVDASCAVRLSLYLSNTRYNTKSLTIRSIKKKYPSQPLDHPGNILSMLCRSEPFILGCLLYRHVSGILCNHFQSPTTLLPFYFLLLLRIFFFFFCIFKNSTVGRKANCCPGQGRIKKRIEPLINRFRPLRLQCVFRVLFTVCL